MKALWRFQRGKKLDNNARQLYDHERNDGTQTDRWSKFYQVPFT